MSKTEIAVGKTVGPSPAESRYYILILFDISDPKKYRTLLKVLKRYGSRVQKSVFEAQLKPLQIKEIIGAIERIMTLPRFYNPDDNIRIYKIASNCEMTVFGKYESNLIEENIFL